MNKKIISCDVDSVLLETEDEIFDFIEKEYNKRITTKDVTHWTYYIEYFPKVLEYFGNPKIFHNVKPIKGMIEVMDSLIKTYGPENIQLVTSSHINIQKAKEEALLKHYGHLEGWNKIDIIHVGLNLEDGQKTHHKHEYTENTIFLDDALHNINDHLNYNHDNLALLIDYGYGWNQNFEHNRCTRITDVKQIPVVIKKILNY